MSDRPLLAMGNNSSSSKSSISHRRYVSENLSVEPLLYPIQEKISSELLIEFKILFKNPFNQLKIQNKLSLYFIIIFYDGQWFELVSCWVLRMSRSSLRTDMRQSIEENKMIKIWSWRLWGLKIFRLNTQCYVTNITSNWIRCKNYQLSS